MLLVSTGRRHVPIHEPSGYLYTIDLESQQVLQRSYIIEPAYRELDNNPRGGMRGSKGIAIREDQIALSNHSMIFRYDPKWDLLGVITHPSCAGIHDITYQNDTLWVTSARSDLLIQFDLSGRWMRHFYVRDPSEALEAIGWKAPVLLTTAEIVNGKIDFRDPRTHELEVYNRAHINGVCVLSNGDILVSLGLLAGSARVNLLRAKVFLARLGVWDSLLKMNRTVRNAMGMKRDIHTDLVVQPAKGQSVVLRIASDGAHALSLVFPSMTVPSHSLLALPDNTAIYLNTTAGTVNHFQPYTGEILSSMKVTDGFLRGVVRLYDGTLVLGSMGELITYDVLLGRVLSRMVITTDPNESVYDIKILPSNFNSPPPSLIDNFKEAVGVSAETIIKDHLELPLLNV